MAEPNPDGAQGFGLGTFGGGSVPPPPDPAYPLGAGAIGSVPIAGGGLADVHAPIVSLIAPTGIGTNGPNVTVIWTYIQSQNVKQSGALIQFYNSSDLSTVVYSTTISGTATTAAVNAITAGLNTQTSGNGLTVKVTAYAGDLAIAASATGAFDLQWGVVTVGIVIPAPSGFVTAPQALVNWTFGSTGGFGQGTYDLQLYDDTSDLLVDTGVISSPTTVGTIQYGFVDSSTYVIELFVTNTNGVGASASVTVSAHNFTVPAGGIGFQRSLSPTTLRIFDEMPLTYRDADVQQTPANPLLSYISLLGEQMGLAEGLFDRIEYIPPDAGGPVPNTGVVHSTSDLVNPYTADPIWLQWLGMVTGVQRQDRSIAQWRVALADSFEVYLAGSKQGVVQAIQELYARIVTPCQLIEGSDVLNAPNSLGINLVSLQDSQFEEGLSGNWSGTHTNPLATTTVAAHTGAQSLSVSAASGVGASMSVTLTSTATVTAGQLYVVNGYVSAKNTGENVTATLAYLDNTQAVLQFITSQTLQDGFGAWTLLQVGSNAPANTASIQVTFTWQTTSGNLTVGETHYLDDVGLFGQVFAATDVGAVLEGQAITSGTTVIKVISPNSVQMSNPSEATLPTTAALVVPPIPVLIFDHWTGDPWTVGIAVPVGTDPVALGKVLSRQQPAGVLFTVLFGVLTWASMYSTYHSGGDSAPFVQSEWSALNGKTWQQLEQLS